MKICIVRLSALGDIVMIIPLINTLLENFPDAEISLITSNAFSPIVEKLQGIELIKIDKITNVLNFFKAKKMLSNYSFDILLATQASMAAHIIYNCINAKRKIGYDKKRSKDFHRFFINERIPSCREHTVDGFLSFAKAVGAKKISLDGRIPITQIDRDFVNCNIGILTYYVIAPFTSKVDKDWPLDRYIEVCNEIYKNNDISVVLTGSKSDYYACDKLKKELHGNVINLAGKTKLREFAAVLEMAKFLITPDSGAAHVGSAMGTPTLGLFATTNPKLTGPYFSSKYTINKHEEALKLYNLQNKWNVRLYNKNVMQLIQPSDILNTLTTNELIH